jgi:sortase A
VSRLLGNLLILTGASGLALLLFAAVANGMLIPQASDAAVVAPPPVTATSTATPEVADVTSATGLGETHFVDLSKPLPSPTPIAPATATPLPMPTQAPYFEITRLVLPRIRLETDVVRAPLVHKDDDSLTWDVPPFVAGHAEGTAGAGEIGNAVLFGHVTSRSLGNVFLTLDKVKVDDEVEVFSGSKLFEYRVVEVHAVARDDVSVLDPTDTPSISLITCTGTWNPVLWDYMQRLVVRAELVTDN